MSWQIEFRPEVEGDIADAAAWYDFRDPGLGQDFVTEVIRVWERLCRDPLTGARGRKGSAIHWHYPKRFPYKVVFEIDEKSRSLLVLAVLHAARLDRHWKDRKEKR